MRATIVRLNLELLVSMLGLPRGVKIDRAIESIAEPDVLELRLVGDGLPAQFEALPGAPIQRSDPLVTLVGNRPKMYWPEPKGAV